MNRYFRCLMFFACAVQAFFAVAFIVQWPIARQAWPLPYTSQMTYLFIGSIFAAAVASTLWCLFSREDGALAGVALDYFTIFTPISIFAFQLAARSSNPRLPVFALTAVAGALFGLGLLLWSARIPIRDPRPMPRPVRFVFGFFVIALLIAGGQLVLKLPSVLPWQVTVEGQVIYGWMFLGAAAYFAYGVLRPSWHNAAGQLAGFLAYDVVLIVPFLLLLPTVNPRWLPNLIVYTLVVMGSGLLAIYYLFINPATRIWRSARLSPVAADSTLSG
jgi:hypothetical protein